MKAREFEKKFDAGEDVIKYLDLKKARRPGHEQAAVLFVVGDFVVVSGAVELGGPLRRSITKQRTGMACSPTPASVGSSNMARLQT